MESVVAQLLLCSTCCDRTAILSDCILHCPADRLDRAWWRWIEGKVGSKTAMPTSLAVFSSSAATHFASSSDSPMPARIGRNHESVQEREQNMVTSDRPIRDPSLRTCSAIWLHELPIWPYRRVALIRCLYTVLSRNTSFAALSCIQQPLESIEIASSCSISVYCS